MGRPASARGGIWEGDWRWLLFGIGGGFGCGIGLGLVLLFGIGRADYGIKNRESRVCDSLFCAGVAAYFVMRRPTSSDEKPASIGSICGRMADSSA